MRSLYAAILASVALSAAALVPVAGLQSYTPPAGWEPNRGQTHSEVLFYSRGAVGISVTAQSLLLTARAVRQTLIASDPNPAVSFLDPLPGTVNVFAGSDPQKWVTGLPRYGTVQLAEVYPGIDVRFSIAADTSPLIRFVVRPGADPSRIRFDIPAAARFLLPSDGTLQIFLTTQRVETPIIYLPLVARQNSATRTAQYTTAGTQVGIQVSGHDPAQPMELEMRLSGFVAIPQTIGPNAVDAAGNVYRGYASTDVVAPNSVPCRLQILSAVPCTDAAIYKYAKTGELLYATYLSGTLDETLGFLGLTPDGALVAAGTTQSANYPATAGAYQTAYAGPAPVPAQGIPGNQMGDLFAAKLDATTGRLTASTYLGGPNADYFGQAAISGDGSVHFLPGRLAAPGTGMPTNGLLRECADPVPQERCRNGYAARLSSGLDRLIYGTYLPGTIIAPGHILSDGTLLFSGSAGSGFPVTAGALQREPGGGTDGVVGRLNAAGTALLAATYIGGPNTDQILSSAMAPDGTVWAAVSEPDILPCCPTTRYRLLHLDANLTRILYEEPTGATDIIAAADGGAYILNYDPPRTTTDALLTNPCLGQSSYGYLELSPAGATRFATYLPGSLGFGEYFQGSSPGNRPMFATRTGLAEIVREQEPVAFAACITDSPSFSRGGAVVPGELVSIFGAGLGPKEGAAFQLVDNRVPTTLAGTRVLVNGQPAPILYSSFRQINTILPYDLGQNPLVTVQVEVNGTRTTIPGNLGVAKSAVTLFRLDGSPQRPAAALNEDGSVNSPANPALIGSRVVLFGSGGGLTNPLGTIGEVYPLRPGPAVESVFLRGVDGQLAVEYVGAAPGLVTGVLQVNVKLPDVIPILPANLQQILPQGKAFVIWGLLPETSRENGFVTVYVTKGPGTPPAQPALTGSASERWFSRTTAGATP